jgi:hypothetical protein
MLNMPESSPIRKALEDYLRLPNSATELSTKTFANTENSHAALDLLWTTLREPRRDYLQALRIDADAIDATIDRVSVALSEKHKRKVESRREALILALESKGKLPADVLVVVNKKLSRYTEAINRTPLQQLSRNTVQLTLKDARSETSSLQRALAKTKTRGTPQDVLLDPAVEIAPPLPAPPPPIEVKRASLEVFQQLFDPTPQARGNLKWVDFASAMIDAGFSMIPKRGSEVTFKDTGGKGSIVVHRPHPGNEVNCNGLAMRLEGRFDWTLESFVERQKVAD